MLENIRSKCIYNIVDEYNSDDEHIWFNYIYLARFECLEIEGNITYECSNKIMKRLGINQPTVNSCVNR